MKKRTIYLIIIASLIISDVYSQKLHKDIIITGKVIDTLINSRPEGKTTVTIIASKYPYAMINMYGADMDKYEVDVKVNEPFRFEVKVATEKIYIYLQYLPGRRDVSWSRGDNIYMFDRGDDISVELSRTDYKFYGKGSEKLNCESELYKLTYNMSNHFVRIANTNNFNNYYNQISAKMDSSLRLQIQTVEKFRPVLGKENSDIMLANCYGLRYYSLLRGSRESSQDFESLNEEVVGSSSYKNINNILGSKVSDTILSQAPLYVDFLFEKLRMDNFLMKDSVLMIEISIGKTFQNIKTMYNGILRDKLLALFFVNYTNVPTSMKYLDEAVNLSGPSMYREFLMNIKKTRITGVDFYPFELENTKGNIVKFSEMGDKVVILDFWYTGCINCVRLKSVMGGIHRIYKNNPKVSFVSISIDKNRQTWLNSVAGAQYCDPDDINLFTGGLGTNHSLIKRYNIPGYPTVFILKKGKMYSTNPPFPATRQAEKDYLKLIDEALLTL